jgi:hypothetical protein
MGGAEEGWRVGLATGVCVAGGILVVVEVGRGVWDAVTVGVDVTAGMRYRKATPGYSPSILRVGPPPKTQPSVAFGAQTNSRGTVVEMGYSFHSWPFQ